VIASRLLARGLPVRPAPAGDGGLRFLHRPRDGDYVYLPLVKCDYLAGKNPRAYRALFITVLLAGIWHGATWMFVAWGLVQGTILTINHVLFDRLRSR
jgi:hypothetical protein